MLTARQIKRGPRTATNSNLVFAERAPHEEGFAHHFEQHIKPKLLAMEKARLATIRAFKLRAALATLGGAVLAGVAFLVWHELENPGEDWFWFAAAFGVSGFFLYGWAQSPSRQYETDRKQAIIPEVLNFVGDFDYKPGGGFKADLEWSRLFKSWNKDEYEDLITGAYHGRRFQFVEAELTDTRGESNDTIFKGFLFTLEMPTAKSRTVAIRERSTAVNWFGRVRGSFKDLAEVNFDDVEIRRNFMIYSTSVETARQLISPRLTKVILELAKLRHAKKVQFSAGGGTFLLAIDTDRDLFEPVKATRSALTIEDTRRFLEEVHEVLEIVEAVATATGSETEPSDNGRSAEHP